MSIHCHRVTQYLININTVFIIKTWFPVKPLDILPCRHLSSGYGPDRGPVPHRIQRLPQEDRKHHLRQTPHQRAAAGTAK